MKLKLLIAIFALFLAVGLPSVAMAYTPPTQFSDNATNVVLWHGDTANVSLSNVNVNLTGSPTVNMVVSTSTTDSLINLVIVLFMVAVGFLYGKTHRYYIDGVVGSGAFIYGLYRAIVNSSIENMTIGIMVALVGAYFIGRLVRKAWGTWKD